MEMPAWSDIQSLDLGADWASCFAVDLALSDPAPYFLYMGEALEEFADAWVVETGAGEHALMDVLLDPLDDIVLAKSEIHLNKTFRLANGGRARLRCIAMPLSDNGADVTHIFGAANGKLVSPPAS